MREFAVYELGLRTGLSTVQRRPNRLLLVRNIIQGTNEWFVVFKDCLVSSTGDELCERKIKYLVYKVSSPMSPALEEIIKAGII